MTTNIKITSYVKPKNHPDALAVKGECTGCHFTMYGSTEGGVKQAMMAMETCPICGNMFQGVAS